MRAKLTTVILSSALATVAVAEAPVFDAHKPIDTRVAQSSLLTLERMHAMQEELRALRGEIEVLRHEVDQLKHKQPGGHVSTSAKVDPVVAPLATETPQITINKNDSAEEQAYQMAYHLVKTNHYKQAMSAFQTFIEAYPEHKNVPNSYYWLGELSVIQKDYANATKHFQFIVEHFPKHPKSADALFKLGVVESTQGHNAKAKLYFHQVIQNYPHSGAAQLAQAKLSSSS